MVGKTRAERKVAAFLRAELSLKHAYERIDHAEDVIAPQLREMRALAATQHVTVEIEAGDLSEAGDGA